MSRRTHRTLLRGLGTTDTEARTPGHVWQSKGGKEGADDYRIVVDKHNRELIQYTDEETNEQLDIDFTRIKTKLKELAKVWDTPIRSLPPDLSRELNQITLVFSDLRNTAIYDALYRCLVEIFEGVPDQLEPGTVGAYFKGCVISANQAGPNGDVACNPLCAGSLRPPSHIAAIDDCEDTVLVYDGNKLSIHHIGKNNQARLFVSSGRFSGLSDKEIDVLARRNITGVQIQLQSKDGQFRTEGHKYIPLANLSRSRYRQKNLTGSGGSGLAAGGILFIIILAIIILLGAALAYAAKRR